jgi:NAD(P)-dependent dehydrogenase (short-subunit alcohol dehydrogenase family)
MQFDLTHKVAIVTGAAHGFGRAIALTLARYGAAVWAVDRLEDELAETAALARQEGLRCTSAVCDVTDSDAVGRLVAGVLGEARQRALVEGLALKRLGSPEDIANGVLFFASDFAGWVTGQTLSIDGGSHMV